MSRADGNDDTMFRTASTNSSGESGGTATPAEKRTYSRDRELAAKAGAKGGSQPKTKKSL